MEGAEVRLHSEASNTISSVPKRNISSIAASRWGVPRHDEDKDVDREGERNGGIPDAKFSALEPEPHASTSDEEETECRGEEEDVRGVRLQINDEIECVSGRRSEDHENRQAPLEGIWRERSAEGTRGGPIRRLVRASNARFRS